jgi:hypothetical protein
MKTQTLLIVGAVVLVGWFLLRPKTTTATGLPVATGKTPAQAAQSNPWAVLAGQVGQVVGALSASGNDYTTPVDYSAGVQLGPPAP